MNKKVKDFIALLEAKGWTYSRTKGDHHVFVNPKAKRCITVPGRGNDDIYNPFLKRLLKEAGLSMEDFNKIDKKKWEHLMYQ